MNNRIWIKGLPERLSLNRKSRRWPPTADRSDLLEKIRAFQLMQYEWFFIEFQDAEKGAVGTDIVVRYSVSGLTNCSKGFAPIVSDFKKQRAVLRRFIRCLPYWKNNTKIQAT